ncbi:tektin-2 [Takifugu flavidus]|uniref:Tektin n=1 Tax=Takifugu flavidus TaxID=433684 RepID=A0A5C6NIF5_9TELE|nr:tektin-2 [Takifugu flavidus]XP_056876491.1 tektin-2 [Takifugu flavidus]XP_056876492.1 tektin-2 [Takifugu flavidus]TWW65830.1 Tektin-2 [Takifugu flavidus]
MSAVSSKPGQHHSVLDWLRNNQQLSATAQSQRLVSAVIRQEGRSLRNQTNCKTAWDESDTSRRLSDRAWEVARWKEALETCTQELDKEMEALALAKEETEQTLAATAAPLEVSRECLTLRDGRRDAELVMDPVDEELKKEVELIEQVQEILQQHIDKSFEHMCILQEARHQLTADIQDKMAALDIDLSCLSLTVKSPQISLKTNPTRIPPGSSTPEEWVQFSQSNVTGAQEAMRVSQQRREDMSLTRAQLQNELDTQRRATEFALRKRNHQEEQARNELEWQLRRTEDEMAEMEADVHELDADLRAKTASLKLAHTRLENRSGRPGVDLCRDKVMSGLIDEVQQLESSITALKQKLSEAKGSLQKMKLHHSRMLQDLSRKREALSLEERSLNTRGRLTWAQPPHRTSAMLVPLTDSSGRNKLQLLAQ